MALHRSKRGLDLPIAGSLNGAAAADIADGGLPTSVALLGVSEFIGVKPTMKVQVGDHVRPGQELYEDKKRPGVRYTSAFGGEVTGVHRGDRRAFLALTIKVDRTARPVGFSSYTGRPAGGLSRKEAVDLLLESGEWTALRARPFGRAPLPETTPAAIVVNGVDSQPLAADPLTLVAGRLDDLTAGLELVSRLTDGPVFVTTRPGAGIELPSGDQFRHEEFAGKHPAGTVGYQIHRLMPVSRERSVWYLDVQEAVALGHLARTGTIDSHRVVACAGPEVAEPRLIKVPRGTQVEPLIAEDPADEATRVIAGSVLSGRALSDPETAFLGRFDRQLSVLAEDRERRLLGWTLPGFNQFSVTRTFASTLLPGKRFRMTTSTHGSPRAIVPIGLYEKVSPFDFEPTFLLKSLVMRDVERAEELGCLELAEEDVDLWTFVCPGKTDYRTPLREVLTELEKEG